MSVRGVNPALSAGDVDPTILLGVSWRGPDDLTLGVSMFCLDLRDPSLDLTPPDEDLPRRRSTLKAFFLGTKEHQYSGS